MVLKNYGSTVYQFSQDLWGTLLRKINALLPSPNYHLPQSTSPHKLALPERRAFQGKGGRLLERFTKRIQGSHGTLQHYIQQHTSTLFSIPYGEDKGSDVLEALRHPESRSPLCEVAVKLLTPKCSSLHDAPRQPFAPNFQSPRVAMTA